MEEKNIEMNGVEYEVKSLIEFSSLAKLLFDLAKRQKDIEHNILTIKNSLNDKDNRLSNLEENILGKTVKDKFIKNIIQTPNIITQEINKQIQKNENDFDTSNKAIDLDNEKINNINYNYKENDFNYLKKENDKEININKDDNKEKENKEIDNKMENISNIEKINEDFFEEKESNEQIKLEPELISKFFKKVNDLEKKVNQMNKYTNDDISPKIESNTGIINNINKQLEQFNQGADEIKKEFLLFKDEFDKVKIKVEDFNIYDIFKGDSSSGVGNTDVNNALIQALEKKVFKKFDIYDEKNKKNDEDLFKTGENIKKLKGLTDNLKNIIHKNTDKIKEIENNFDDYKNVINKRIDEIKDNNTLIQNDLHSIENKNDTEKKLKDLEDKLNKLLEKPKEQIIIKQNDEVEPQFNKKFEEFDNLIKEIKKSMNQTEKNINKKIDEENKATLDKISLLEKEIQTKLNAKELSQINDKLYNLEEIIKSLNSNFDILQQYSEKFKSDFNNIYKKLEFLYGEIYQLKEVKDKDVLKKYSGFDTNNFLSQPIFNLFKKEVASRFEKIKTDLDHLNNNFETISSSLNSLPSNKDFSKFQNGLINLIEDLKTSFHKKYMERSDIQRALKLIDNQIKTLNEVTKKYEASDTWLLAKKPIGNYQCASCEANLKDLEHKDNFVAWNRYPTREEKTYRIGHGYSRILEMVNEEVIKSFENKDNKGYVSDDDKKSGKSNSRNKNKSKLNESTNLPEKKMIKLPKVNKNILNLNSEKLNFSTSPYEVTDSSNQEEPKVTRIYKVNNKKNLGFFKTKTENNDLISINIEKTTKKSNNKNSKLQMNLTMPNNS